MYTLCRLTKLEPDPDGVAQCLSKTMRPDSGIWVKLGWSD